MSSEDEADRLKEEQSVTKVKVPAKEESVSSASRKALMTTVIAIALNPVSLVAGYFINHLLQAPKLEIQYSVPVYSSLGKKLGLEGIKALADSPRMNSAVRNTIAQRVPAGSQQPVCTLWLDEQDWDENCEDQVLDSINGLRQTLMLETKALANNIQIIKAWQPPSKLILEPVNTPDSEVMRMMQSIQGGQFDRQQALAQFQYYLTQERTGLKALENLKKAFDDMLKAPESVTEALAFDIGVLNSGDSDGVIFNTGTVTFGSTKLPLSSDDYRVVKAHSFESVRFRMFYGQIDPERQTIQNVVKNRDTELPFHIAIKVGKITIDADGVLPKNEE